MLVNAAQHGSLQVPSASRRNRREWTARSGWESVPRVFRLTAVCALMLGGCALNAPRPYNCDATTGALRPVTRGRTPLSRWIAECAKEIAEASWPPRHAEGLEGSVVVKAFFNRNDSARSLLGPGRRASESTGCRQPAPLQVMLEATRSGTSAPSGSNEAE
jgi:hypothetical protein